jgi:ABC-type multidrug transport system fused ATPase/permease subunit
MSTTAIIVIVVVVLLILAALAFALPRIRARAQERSRQRELGQRREQAVTEHQEESSIRDRRANAAEQRARIAEQEAAKERAEAQLQKERANMHEQGLADHELMPEEELPKERPGVAADERRDVATEDRGGEETATGARVADRSDRDLPADDQAATGRSEIAGPPPERG